MARDPEANTSLAFSLDDPGREGNNFEIIQKSVDAQSYVVSYANSRLSICAVLKTQT